MAVVAVAAVVVFVVAVVVAVVAKQELYMEHSLLAFFFSFMDFALWPAVIQN